MEGASSTISIDNGFVIKKIKRKINTMPIKDQFMVHNLVYKVLNTDKYKLLCTPKPLELSNDNSYKMEIIIDSNMITSNDYDNNLTKEIKQFYVDMKAHNIFPNDFELFLQPNGKVALIDFDKFGKYYDDTFEIIIFHFNKEKHLKKNLLIAYNLPPGFVY